MAQSNTFQPPPKRRCEICGAWLDPDSKAYCNPCDEKRAAFYAGGGFDVAEVDALAALDQADVTRWLRSMRHSLYNDDYGTARIYYENALKAVKEDVAATAAA